MSDSNNIFTKFKNMPVDGIVKTVIVATPLGRVGIMLASESFTLTPNAQARMAAAVKRCLTTPEQT